MYINTTGSSAMAKAGAGDVLTGVIAGFLAQGVKAFEAAILGTHIHGKAGELTKESYGLLPEELANYISLVLAEQG